MFESYVFFLRFEGVSRMEKDVIVVYRRYRLGFGVFFFGVKVSEVVEF